MRRLSWGTSYYFPVHLYKLTWTSLVVQWLRPRAPNAGGPGLIPDQETRCHIPQLRLKRKKILPAATKTQRDQIHK